MAVLADKRIFLGEFHNSVLAISAKEYVVNLNRGQVTLYSIVAVDVLDDGGLLAGGVDQFPDCADRGGRAGRPGRTRRARWPPAWWSRRRATRRTAWRRRAEAGTVARGSSLNAVSSLSGLNRERAASKRSMKSRSRSAGTGIFERSRYCVEEGGGITRQSGDRPRRSRGSRHAIGIGV